MSREQRQRSGNACTSLGLAVVLFASALYPVSAADGVGFHGRNPREGWFWYQVPPAPAKPARQLPVRPNGPTAAAAPANPDLAAFKDFQRRMEEALQMAVINPSEANVLNYLTLWQQSKQKASVFTDMAQAVAWRTPSVNDDFLGVRPTSPAATQVFDQQREDEQAAIVTMLARTHGMFFFFRSDCPYCHAMAPMLKQFSAKYGMTVYPVSMDGGGLPEYPNARRDNGIAARLITELGIPPEEFQVPFTVLARPGTREVLPVGFGVMTAAEMVERIAMVLRLRSQQVDGQQADGQSAQGAPASLRSRPMGPDGLLPAGTSLGAARTTPAPLAAR